MDLFAFDRDGSRVLVFEKTETENWKERPDWSVVAGPEALGALRDFDCDGLPDLFTGYQNSIHVYRNTTAAPGVPTFEPYALPLTASWDFGTGAQELPLVCLTIDKPAIFDVDNDGDLDFICFTETSTSLYRFSGQSACGLTSFAPTGVTAWFPKDRRTIPCSSEPTTTAVSTWLTPRPTSAHRSEAAERWRARRWRHYRTPIRWRKLPRPPHLRRYLSHHERSHARGRH